MSPFIKAKPTDRVSRDKMADKMAVMETFLPVEITEAKETYNRDRSDNLFIRFLRKKYKCLIMFLLATISVFQSLTLVLINIDKDLLTRISDSVTSITKTNLSLSEDE